MYIIQWLMEDPMGALVYMLCIFLAMCISMTAHECAHAYVAYKLGDPTAKNMGRLSLDPLKHLDPIGTLCFIFLGFGWAKPVIVNSRNLKHYRRDDIFISLAGPAANLVLSFLFYGIFFFLPNAWKEIGIVSQIFTVLIMVNVSLAVFNVLPIPPLDGFHVVSSIFIRKSYKVVEFLNRYGFLLLIVLVVTDVIPMLLQWVQMGLLSIYHAFFSLFI